MADNSYAILAGSAVILALGIGLSLLLRRRWTRGYVVMLSARLEAIAAAQALVEKTVTQMRAASETERTLFACESDREERRALAEVGSRMRLEGEELVTMALPRELWSAAELLAKAAETLAQEAGRVASASSSQEVLKSLDVLDIDLIGREVASAEGEIRRLCARYGCEEASVYGGGMYV